MEGHLPEGKCIPCFSAERGRAESSSLSAVSHLLSLQNNPMSKWHILRWHVLVPFIMNQLNGNAPIIQRRKSNQVSSLRTYSFCEMELGFDLVSAQ